MFFDNLDVYQPLVVGVDRSGRVYGKIFSNNVTKVGCETYLVMKNVEAKTDEMLMEDYQNGDERAFEILFRRYQGKIYGFLVAKMKDEILADDVFQGTFLKLHQTKTRYDVSMPFAPWLFMICRSVLLDKWKELRRSPIFFADTLDDLRSTGHPEVAGTVDLEEMSEEQRSLVELRYLQGLSFQEIAVQLGISDTTARQRLSRAVRRLKNIKTGGHI